MQEGCLTVVSVDFIEEEVDVFDISVEDDHSFLVHGAVLHNCVECGEMDGQSWEWGTPHPMPALHMGCFVADTKIVSPKILRGFDRPYSGDVVIIRTARGHEITCTPNHPILTPRGWISAGQFKEGDKIVTSSVGDGVLTSAPDGVEIETRIEDVVTSLLANRGMRPISVPLSPEDFHGDVSNQQIAIVWSNGELWNGVDPSGLEHPEELGLVNGTPSGDSSLTCQCGKRLLDNSLDPSLRGFMGLMREAQSLVFGGLGHPGKHSFTPISGSNTSLLEPESYPAPREPKMGSQGLNARSGVVEPNHLESVDGDPSCECESGIMQSGIDSLPVNVKGITNFDDTHAVLKKCNDLAMVDGVSAPQAKNGNPIRLEDCDHSCSGNPVGPSNLGNGIPGTVSRANIPFVNNGGLRADGDTVHLEQLEDELVTHPEFERKLMHGCAIPVCLDDVVSVRNEFFNGHVYNLETEGNWYVANGIIAHNCRCSLLPLTKSFEQLARESHGNSRIAKVLDDIPEANRASMGGPVSGKLTYKDWFSRLSESRQREILGPGRFDLYKKGLIGYSDMIGQNGNELTLAELRDKLT